MTASNEFPPAPPLDTPPAVQPLEPDTYRLAAIPNPLGAARYEARPLVGGPPTLGNIVGRPGGGLYFLSLMDQYEAEKAAEHAAQHDQLAPDPAATEDTPDA